MDIHEKLLVWAKWINRPRYPFDIDMEKPAGIDELQTAMENVASRHKACITALRAYYLDDNKRLPSQTFRHLAYVGRQHLAKEMQ